MAAPRSVPVLAAVALVGAGAVHVAMAIAERDRIGVMVALLVAGVVEVAWGAVALASEQSSPRREVAGLVIALASFGGWLLAVLAHEAATPDLLAALLAVVAAASLVRRLLGGVAPSATGRGALVAPLAMAAIAVVAVVAVPRASQDRREPPGERTEVASEGTPTSTASTEEKAAAADLVTSVLDEQAGYPTAEEAPRRGYRSIGDAFTGEEHVINWSLVDDGRALDPAAPEALVYDVDDDGGRTLVAVMFLEPPGTRLDDAPAPGGSLTRWHLHGDVCLDPSTDPPSAAGTTDATGACPDGLEEQRRFPTLHVWLVPHPCGPFSELEGVGTDPAAITGGCEHQHG